MAIRGEGEKRKARGCCRDAIRAGERIAAVKGSPTGGLTVNGGNVACVLLLHKHAAGEWDVERLGDKFTVAQRFRCPLPTGKVQITEWRINAPPGVSYYVGDIGNGIE